MSFGAEVAPPLSKCTGCAGNSFAQVAAVISVLRQSSCRSGRRKEAIASVAAYRPSPSERATR